MTPDEAAEQAAWDAQVVATPVATAHEDFRDGFRAGLAHGRAERSLEIKMHAGLAKILEERLNAALYRVEELENALEDYTA